MTSQQLADILLHHKRLLWWMKREDRDRMLMQIADDYEFETKLEIVSREMADDASCQA